MNQINQTNEYSIFKTLNGNRPLSKPHLRKLKGSIEKDNRLNLHPIIVNDRMEVIDGQHRLQCARELGVNIFYIASSTITDDHLIDCNVNQRQFEVDNYIDYFAIKEKKPEYIVLKDLMDSTGLKTKAILSLILGVNGNNLMEFVKTGKFKFPSNHEHSDLVISYTKFIKYVDDKRIRPLAMFSNNCFTKAFRWIYMTNGFNVDLFYKKLDQRWFDLKPQRTPAEWYQLLINIYNFKNHNRLEDEFSKFDRE